MNFEDDILKASETLSNGKLILYPTDTIWGIGADATDTAAVDRIFKLKRRDDSKALVVLVSSEKDIFKYATHFDPGVFDYIESAPKPVTVIYEGATGLAENLLAADGSVGIRIVKNDFCKMLIRRFGKPIVSTSANISGQAPPSNFNEVDVQIKNGVDFIVQHRQKDFQRSTASMIVRWEKDGTVRVIRN